MSNIKIPNALNLLSVSDQVSDLPPKLFELLHTYCHHDLFVLSCLDFNYDLWSEYFVEIVGGEHYIDLPLTCSVIKTT